MTCAHRSLPFGTKLKVTNLENNKTVVVTVNDRGPFVKTRVLDLSKAAAKKLDFYKAGQAKVQVEIIPDPTLPTTTSIDTSPKIYAIKIASYKSQTPLFERLKTLSGEVSGSSYIQTEWIDEDLVYDLMAGKFAEKAEAEKFLRKVKLQCPNCMVVEVK